MCAWLPGSQSAPATPSFSQSTHSLPLRPLRPSPLSLSPHLTQRQLAPSKCSWQKLTKFVAAIFGKNYVKFGFSCQKSFAQEKCTAKL